MPLLLLAIGLYTIVIDAAPLISWALIITATALLARESVTLIHQIRKA